MRRRRSLFSPPPPRRTRVIVHGTQRTEQRDLVVLRVERHKGVEAAADAARAALLDAVAQEHDLALVGVEHDADDVALCKVGRVGRDAPAADADDAVGQIVRAVAQVLRGRAWFLCGGGVCVCVLCVLLVGCVSVGGVFGVCVWVWCAGRGRNKAHDTHTKTHTQHQQQQQQQQRSTCGSESSGMQPRQTPIKMLSGSDRLLTLTSHRCTPLIKPLLHSTVE